MRPARSSLRLLAAACVATVVAAACSVGQARVGAGGERAMAAALSATAPATCTRHLLGSADRSRHRHQQHHPRHRDHAGEPLVRSLLRHVPRRRRIPAGRAGPHRRVRPRPPGGDLSTAVSRHEPVRCRRPPRPPRFDDRRERRTDGRIRQGAGADRQRMSAPARCVPVPGGHAGPGRAARHHGVSHRKRDPELLGVCEALRAAGPHVRAGVFVDPSLTPVPGVGVGGDMSRPRRRDELSIGSGVPGEERS